MGGCLQCSQAASIRQLDYVADLVEPGQGVPLGRKDRHRHPDIGDKDPSRIWCAPQPGLGCYQRYRGGRADGALPTRAAVRVQPRRDIDGDDRYAARVHRPDDAWGGVSKWQPNPDTEQPIEDGVGGWVDALGRLHHLYAEAPNGQSLARGQAGRVTGGHGRRYNDGTSLIEEPGRDQRITSVVARPGNHDDAFPTYTAHQLIDEPRDLPARDLHQLDRLDPEVRPRLLVRLAQRR